MQPQDLIIAPLVVGIVEAFKRTGLISRKYAAMVALGVAAFLVIGTYALKQNGAGSLAEAILQAIGTGLSASGLYSVARAVTSTPTNLAGPSDGVARGTACP